MNISFKLASCSLIILLITSSLVFPLHNNNSTIISSESCKVFSASNHSLLNWRGNSSNIYHNTTIRLNSRIENEYSFSSSRIETFSFVDVTVEVRDAYGHPVSSAWVKAFSEDWGITYPHSEEWGLTSSLGIYNFRLPKGKWTFIASTGRSYSNEGIFVAVTKSVESNDYLILRPKERLNIEFIDENGAYIKPDEIYIFLTRLIPALPPALVGVPSQGTFSLYIGGNLSYGLTILGIKRSTTSINYLLVGKTSLNETAVVISAKNSAEITFEAYNPDKSPSTYWNVEFRLPELYLGNWVYCFQIYGRTVVKISPMKIVLNPRFIPPNWYYYFEHIYLEPKENSKYLYRLGGKFSFHFWVIKEDTQLWFDIRDEFGNVLAFYSDPNNSRYIKLRIYENNVVVYDKNIGPEIPGTLFYGVGKTFQDDATYNLEVDAGPILGLIRRTGFLYNNDHIVRYINFTVNSFNFNIPEEYFWTIANQSRVSVFVDSVLKLYNSIGSFVEEDLEAKPFTVKVNFEWCGVSGYRFIGFGVGVARWPLMVPCYAYGAIVAHELGHLYSFTSSKPYYVECPWFCEPLATYLGIEGIANIYGDNVRLWYWGSHPFFFDYVAGKANTPYPDEVESMQFIFFYIHKIYGPAVHKKFFKKWNQASSILRRYGYSNLESVVTLYSLLINENIAWLFNLAGFKVNSDKILEGMKVIQLPPLLPITVTIEGLPSSYTISVYIDENLVGYIQGGDSKTFEVDKERVKVKVEPSEIKTNDTIYKVENDTLTVNSGEEAVFRYYAKYLVCIDNSCSYFEKGSIISPKQDILTLGGLIIKRFEGYIDNYGNNIGKSIVVNGPLKLSSVYREELNLPLLSVIIVVVLIPLFVIKIIKGSGAIVKTEEKAGTEVREPTELEKELATLNENIAKLEELYKKGEIEEYAYKVLKEEYESKKKEIEKKMKK